MAEVSITLNNRSYDIACDAGQEGRIVDLAAYIDQRLQQIARSGGAYNEAHLLVLTTLVLADEVFELQDGAAPQARPAPVAQQPAAPAPAAAPAASKEDELALAKLLDQVAKRIDSIAQRVQSA